MYVFYSRRIDIQIKIYFQCKIVKQFYRFFPFDEKMNMRYIDLYYI